MAFNGAPYPIIPTPQGFFKTQTRLNTIKADLLQLLLTNPGERIMLPSFGTPLRQLLFEPNDETLVINVRQVIIDAIKTWEPRIVVQELEVSNSIDNSSLDTLDDLSQKEHILSIIIRFFDPEEIDQVEELSLELPISGG